MHKRTVTWNDDSPPPCPWGGGLFLFVDEVFGEISRAPEIPKQIFSPGNVVSADRYQNPEFFLCSAWSTALSLHPRQLLDAASVDQGRGGQVNQGQGTVGTSGAGIRWRSLGVHWLLFNFSPGKAGGQRS